MGARIVCLYKVQRQHWRASSVQVAVRLVETRDMMASDALCGIGCGHANAMKLERTGL